MRIVDGFDGLDAMPLGFCQRGACGFADAVDRQDRRAVEARRKVGRSGVCQMVGYEMKFWPEGTSEQFLGDYNVAEFREGLVKTARWFLEVSGRTKKCTEE